MLPFQPPSAPGSPCPPSFLTSCGPFMASTAYGQSLLGAGKPLESRDPCLSIACAWSSASNHGGPWRGVGGSGDEHWGTDFISCLPVSCVLCLEQGQHPKGTKASQLFLRTSRVPERGTCPFPILSPSWPTGPEREGGRRSREGTRGGLEKETLDRAAALLQVVGAWDLEWALCVSPMYPAVPQAGKGLGA